MEGIQCSCEEFTNKVKRQITVIIGKYLKMILEKGNHYFTTTLATGQCGQHLVFCRCGLFPSDSQKIKVKLIAGNLLKTSRSLKTTTSEDRNIRLNVD